MQLGAVLHAQAREEYAQEVQRKNAQLSEQLGLCMLQLDLRCEELEAAQVVCCSPPSSPQLTDKCSQARKAVLEDELKAAREKLEEYERREREELEQDRLAVAIWGCKRQPDATWDTPPTMLSEVDRPITVNRVAGELGLKCRTPGSAHRLYARVHEAYLRAHGRPPTPMIYYDGDGIPERVSCYTERDRGLILGVLKEQRDCL
jgi:hypothetical protein